MKIPGIQGSFHKRKIKSRGKTYEYWYHYIYDPKTKKMKSIRRDPPYSADFQLNELINTVNDLASFSTKFFQCEICHNWYHVNFLEIHHDGIAKGRENLPDLPFIDWEGAKDHTTRKICIFCHPQTAASILRNMTPWQKKKIFGEVNE